MLTILAEAPRAEVRRFKCGCACGKTIVVRLDSLTKGKTTSCGCFHTQILVARFTKHGEARVSNRTPEYLAWQNIKQRCYNQDDPSFHNYGGRGITVCDRWLNSFPNFLSDVGRRPSPKHSIDRWPNNDGNYEPGNVRWATPDQQTRNTRANVVIAFNGESKCIQDWALETGIPAQTISHKHKTGCSVQEIFASVKTTQGVTAQ